MKIRNDFVTNSSSSSFVVSLIAVDEKSGKAVTLFDTTENFGDYCNKSSRFCGVCDLYESQDTYEVPLSRNKVCGVYVRSLEDWDLNALLLDFLQGKSTATGRKKEILEELCDYLRKKGLDPKSVTHLISLDHVYAEGMDAIDYLRDHVDISWSDLGRILTENEEALEKAARNHNTDVESIELYRQYLKNNSVCTDAWSYGIVSVKDGEYVLFRALRGDDDHDLPNMTELIAAAYGKEVPETQPVEEVTTPKKARKKDEIIDGTLYIADGITVIENGKYKKKKKFTSVVIPEGVTEICEDAFLECETLESVTIPASVTKIGNAAFKNCKGVKEVHITDLSAWCRIQFGSNVFGRYRHPLYNAEPLHLYLDGEEITSLIIPEDVTEIGNCAFESCKGLTSVTIPKSVTKIGCDAFCDCKGLKEVHITDLAAWCRIQFHGCSSTPLRYAKHLYLNGEEITSLIIPEDVTEIGKYAFSGCEGLTSVAIHKSVTEIGEEAFSYCKGLTSVAIPEGVIKIGYEAFRGCTGLTSVTIPDSVTEIGGYAFRGCESLTSVIIPEGVTEIGNYAFDGCSSLTSITIPDGVTSIGDHAFEGCTGLTSITIPDSVTSIGQDAFKDCRELPYSTFQNGKYLGTEENPYLILMEWNEQTQVSNRTKFIYGYWHGFGEGHAFTTTPELTIPEGVVSIGADAFKSCKKLQSVRIPASVKSICDNAFGYCDRLKEVHITDLAAWCRIQFHGYSSNPLDYAKQLYLNGEEITSLIIPEDVTEIGKQAFKYCEGLTSVTIHEGVTEIGEKAFHGCSALRKIIVDEKNPRYISKGNCLIDTETKTLILGCKNSVIPNDGSVTCIGEGAFYGCKGLKSIIIPASVTKIGKDAFCGCKGLTSLVLPASILEIGFLAFSSCDKLATICCEASTQPTGWNETWMGYQCKAQIIWGYVPPSDEADIPEVLTASWHVGQSKLPADLIIPEGVTAIDKGAFMGCDKIKSITIPSSVTRIGKQAFMNCTGLTSIVLPSSITEMGTSVFEGCKKLTLICCEAAKKPKDWSTSWMDGTGKLKAQLVWGYTQSTGEKEAFPAVLNANWRLNYTDMPADLVIPEGVTTIEKETFMGCKALTSVVIPNSVTEIGKSAFEGCTKLASITFGHGVTTIAAGAFRGCRALTAVTFPECVTSISEEAFKGCTHISTISFGGVTAIGRKAFSGCKGLTTLTIPSSVKTIGTGAFSSCGELETLTLEEGIEKIGEQAFAWCTKIKILGIPSSVTYVDNEAFKSCSRLRCIYCIKENFGGYGWLNGCDAHVVEDCTNVQENDEYIYHIRDEKAILLQYIGKNTEVIIPETIEGHPVVDLQATFSGNEEITSVVIPNGVTEIGDHAFMSCKALTYVSIPGSVSSVGQSAFRCCKALTSVAIGTGVTKIGDYAFSGCTGLTSVTIPGSVTKIGEAAFSDCQGLTEVHITDLSAWCRIRFYDYRSNPLYYTKHLYLNGEKTTHLVIPEDVTVIRERVFSFCNGLTSVTIGNGVTKIGEEAFKCCNGLTSIIIPDSVTSIGEYAFYGCEGLTSVTIPDSVTKIGDYAFDGCESLESIILPASITKMGSYIFSGCKKLTTIFCEAKNRPMGWQNNWRGFGWEVKFKVIWGYQPE